MSRTHPFFSDLVGEGSACWEGGESPSTCPRVSLANPAARGMGFVPPWTLVYLSSRALQQAPPQPAPAPGSAIAKPSAAAEAAERAPAASFPPVPSARGAFDFILNPDLEVVEEDFSSDEGYSDDN
jgi:hypothetical protein